MAEVKSLLCEKSAVLIRIATGTALLTTLKMIRSIIDNHNRYCQFVPMQRQTAGDFTHAYIIELAPGDCTEVYTFYRRHGGSVLAYIGSSDGRITHKLVDEL